MKTLEEAGQELGEAWAEATREPRYVIELVLARLTVVAIALGDYLRRRHPRVVRVLVWLDDQICM